MMWALLAYRPPAGPFFVPSDLFAFFFALRWSPATFFPASRTALDDMPASEDGQRLFLISYVIACVLVGVGFILFRGISRETALASRERSLRGLPMLSEKSARAFCLMMVSGAAVMILGYLASSELRLFLTDIKDYVTSSQLVSYSELRRDSVRGGVLFSVFYSRLQYSVVALLFVGLIVCWLRKGWRGFPFFVLAFVLFLVCGASLHKGPYVYYLMFSGVSWIVWRQVKTRGDDNKRLLFTVFAGVLLVMVAVVGLYFIQYRDSSTSFARVIETTYFRIGRAFPDSFKLYVELYPDVIPYTLGRSIGLLQPIFGHHDNPGIMVAAYFGKKTTFPAGFFAFGYAEFGLIGVTLYSVLVALLIQYANRVALHMKTVEFRVLSTTALGVAMMQLMGRPFAEALLTGGIGVFIILITLASSWMEDLGGAGAMRPRPRAMGKGFERRGA